MNINKIWKNHKGDGEIIIGIIIILAVLLVAGAIWAGIHFGTKPKYEATTKFAYSVDDGMTYREGIQVINVGQRYYLSVDMKVAVSKNPRKEKVSATLTLPNVSIVDATLFDSNGGKKITGDPDPISNTRKYEFKIVPSTDPQKFYAVFEFVPNSAGIYTFSLTYDDKLDPAYDMTETIRFE